MESADTAEQYVIFVLYLVLCIQLLYLDFAFVLKTCSTVAIKHSLNLQSVVLCCDIKGVFEKYTRQSIPNDAY